MINSWAVAVFFFSAVAQFDLPYLQIVRVKEFKFREIPRTRTISEEETRERERSVDNLMQVYRLSASLSLSLSTSLSIYLFASLSASLSTSLLFTSLLLSLLLSLLFSLLLYKWRGSNLVQEAKMFPQFKKTCFNSPSLPFTSLPLLNFFISFSLAPSPSPIFPPSLCPSCVGWRWGDQPERWLHKKERARAEGERGGREGRRGRGRCSGQWDTPPLIAMEHWRQRNPSQRYWSQVYKSAATVGLVLLPIIKCFVSISLNQPWTHKCIHGHHKSIRNYMGVFILGINTLYTVFCLV